MRRVLPLVLAAACTTGQARTAHRAGELAAGGALLAMLAVIGAAELIPSEKGAFLDAGIVFVPIAVGGALTYAATDSTVNRRDAPDVRSDRARDAAMQLAREAKHSARAGDCANVLAIEPRVRELDDTIYARFRRDKVIRRCFAPVSEPAVPDGPPPSLPVAPVPPPPSPPPSGPPASD